MVNKVILIGNVGKDPEVRHTEGKRTVANFTLATSERYRDSSNLPQERTEWHNIVCWGPTADVVEKFVRKGSQIFVEGKLRTRNYDAKDGSKRYVTEVYVDTLQLLGRKGDNAASNVQPAEPARTSNYSQSQFTPQPPTPSSAPFESNVPDFGGTDTDDLPF